jgi:predicted nucleotidyltransferase
MTKGKSLDVETVWLLARDEANNESETNWDEVFAFQSDLEELLKKKVDLVSSEGLSRHVRPFVDRDKTLLYEKGE